MESKIKQLKSLIDNSQKILITSHISPDPDAISSVLLLGTTLKHNYPDKEIVMVLEEEPEGLDFLIGYKDIKFSSLLRAMQVFEPDIFLMLDVPNYERCSRFDGPKISQFITDNGVKTAVIDHHEPAGKDETDIYINQGSIATTQDVYEVCFGQLKLEKPAGYGETTMLGIYSDSGGFTYANPRNRETFKIVSDLIDAGVDIEDLKNQLSRYSPDQIKALAEFINNISGDRQYTVSHLSDEFVRHWQATGKSLVSLNTAAAIFVDLYIRNIGNNKWGFIVYLNPLAGDDTYSVSLRSQSGITDVSQIANRLGGGGHKPAAGGKIQASSVEEAIQKVQDAISSS